MKIKGVLMTDENVTERSDDYVDHGEFIRTILVAVFIALLIRTFAFEPFNIPSGSMLPTLMEGDYLFVSKYSYGYGQYSFPFGLVKFKGRLWEKKPERGDIVVFRQPKNDRIDYIKRVIGLPGDKVQVRNGLLFINGEPVPRERVDTVFLDDELGGEDAVAEYLETLPNGVKHRIYEYSDHDRYDNTPTLSVPDGYYLAMGDNRDRSVDSRATEFVGLVPRENLIGRAEIIFFSTNGSAKIWELWKWPVTIRYDRMFKILRTKAE